MNGDDMTKEIQVSIAQLDNYGPWTVSPEPKPEAYLQMLQTRLFADLEEGFSERGGLAFLGRFDNTLAVSNGISLDQHKEIQERIDEHYPVTVSFGVGTGETAYEAQKQASESLQATGSSQSSERIEEIAGETLGSADEGQVQIAHLDINHVTDFTDVEPFFDAHQMVQKVYVSLLDSFKKRDSLVFFTGGDNYMAPSNGLDEEDIIEVISEVEEDTEIKLKAGVGRAKKAVEAAYLADEGLHEVRDDDTEEEVIMKISDR